MPKRRVHTHMKYLSKLFIVLIVFVAFFVAYKVLNRAPDVPGQASSRLLWKIQSVDTMKFSRDLAREKLNDKAFEATIAQQVKQIADTGATHVAVGTPYEEEFVPFLAKWVDAARQNNIKVWFRGNLAGWEGWFSYPKISTNEHTAEVVSFITKHPELFSDGDIFTSCPECENGGPGDPRMTNDVASFRSFLISEHNSVVAAFKRSNKNVLVGLYSMNGDVAKLTMDPETTKALGGYVSVDHYVQTPEQLSADIEALVKSSGGKVVLGEWGAPIPDINGKMTDEQQADWISAALSNLSQVKGLVGLNYWTGYGSSTAIWTAQGEPRPAVSLLTGYYKPVVVSGSVVNEIDNMIEGAEVKTALSQARSDSRGRFTLTFTPADKTVTVRAAGYDTQVLDASQIGDHIVLVKSRENVLFRFAKFLKNLQK